MKNKKKKINNKMFFLIMKELIIYNKLIECLICNLKKLIWDLTAKKIVLILINYNKLFNLYYFCYI